MSQCIRCGDEIEGRPREFEVPMQVGTNDACLQCVETCQPCAEDLAGLFHDWIEEKDHGNTVSLRSRGIIK